MRQPNPTELHRLRPLDSLAWLHVVINLLLFGSGLTISLNSEHAVTYVAAQVLLAIGFTHSFVLLHEAGHRTLFRGRRLNDAFGLLAGFLSLIPYATWRPVHARHHRYTGWQDLDATTASLLPRPLARWEQIVINGAWRFWLPLFSVVYRIQNYWRIGRIKPYLGSSVRVSRLRLAAGLQFLSYVLLIAGWGLPESLSLFGPGLFIALMAQDILLLSQHTNMPTNISQGRPVRPFKPSEQVPFTRSLRLPEWLSWLLLHFDAHELHHLYPSVPGYFLRCVPYSPPNEVPWLNWLRDVKRLSGVEFLFGESDARKEKA